MTKASVEELKGQVAAGEYAIDSRELADTILTNFALIKRIKRLLMGEAPDSATGEAGPRPQRRRREWPAASRPIRPGRERLQ